MFTPYFQTELRAPGSTHYLLVLLSNQTLEHREQQSSALANSAINLALPAGFFTILLQPVVRRATPS